MQTKASLLALIQELEGDIGELDKAAALNARAWARIQAGAVDPLDWGALGYTIHSAYGIIENYCLRISKRFENHLDADSWRKSLIEKMAIQIPGVRHALIPDGGLKKKLIEVLKFRHRFRNLYGEELDPGKTEEIQSTFVSLLPELMAAHGVFVGKIQAICEAL